MFQFKMNAQYWLSFASFFLSTCARAMRMPFNRLSECGKRKIIINVFTAMNQLVAVSVDVKK